ncbi:type II toxin-antitoxin system VapC family toxin [Leucobacter sp. wl10]|uniref:type II toxin-antitoxin system VapC family toxin n=1 Tax=Leucobacter sp. wl10 TaxID=2304677 RepID=UPI000E5A8C66|nr:type II toxin-antitoxin system VapC family toxin [Leucobacter sp. wl10]RGE20723.1 type II toxin-antitoxin system VapC family toxin [Leucobacter sp. wl10]
MRFLLDTNVVSEIRKPARVADAQVRAWFAAQHADELLLSVISILEIELGIARLERRDAPQAGVLRAWLDDELLDGFAGRVLDVDIAVARAAARMHVPDPRAERDALIAATAQVHGLTVATRNLKDFESLGVELLSPWAGSSAGSSA